MSAERQDGSYTKKQVIGAVAETYFQTLGTIFKPGVDRIVEATHIFEYPEGFTERFIDLLAHHDGVPIFVSSHSGHIDGVTAGRASHILLTQTNEHLPKERQFKGVILPVAASLPSGHQGPFLQRAYEYSVPDLAAHNVTPVSIVREKDIQKYGMEPDTRGNTERLHAGIRDNHGVLLLPEGTVQGGRTDQDGNLFGLQPFEDKSLMLVTHLIKRQGKLPVYVFMGNFGGHRVVSPDTNFFTREAMYAGMHPHTPPLVAIKFGRIATAPEVETLVKARGERFIWQTLNAFAREEVRKLLPRRVKGQE